MSFSQGVRYTVLETKSVLWFIIRRIGTRRRRASFGVGFFFHTTETRSVQLTKIAINNSVLDDPTVFAFPQYAEPSSTEQERNGLLFIYEQIHCWIEQTENNSSGYRALAGSPTTLLEPSSSDKAT